MYMPRGAKRNKEASSAQKERGIMAKQTRLPENEAILPGRLPALWKPGVSFDRRKQIEPAIAQITWLGSKGRPKKKTNAFVVAVVSLPPPELMTAIHSASWPAQRSASCQPGHTKTNLSIFRRPSLHNVVANLLPSPDGDTQDATAQKKKIARSSAGALLQARSPVAEAPLPPRRIKSVFTMETNPPSGQPFRAGCKCVIVRSMCRQCKFLFQESFQFCDVARAKQPLKVCANSSAGNGSDAETWPRSSIERLLRPTLPAPERQIDRGGRRAGGGSDQHPVRAHETCPAHHPGRPASAAGPRNVPEPSPVGRPRRRLPSKPTDAVAVRVGHRDRAAASAPYPAPFLAAAAVHGGGRAKRPGARLRVAAAGSSSVPARLSTPPRPAGIGASAAGVDAPRLSDTAVRFVIAVLAGLDASRAASIGKFDGPSSCNADLFAMVNVYPLQTVTGPSTGFAAADFVSERGTDRGRPGDKGAWKQKPGATSGVTVIARCSGGTLFFSCLMNVIISDPSRWHQVLLSSFRGRDRPRGMKMTNEYDS
ncbi:hypothetical protein CDD83_2567 [Cordyceps sp. RAO-2017]|nr:hypothetical protein CDD83_2567 [Cordyceps sp. RAO-2017]